MTKKKNKEKRSSAKTEIINTQNELKMILRKRKTKAPGFDELFQYLDDAELRSYKQWDSKMRSQYGNVYESIACLLVHPIKNKSIADADYWYVDIMMALAFEILSVHIGSNIGEYMDDLIAAALDPRKTDITELSDPESSNCLYILSRENKKIWYDAIYPANMINFLFHTKEGAGASIAKKSVFTIITRMLCNTSHVSIMAKITIEAFKAVVQKLCAKLVEAQSNITSDEKVAKIIKDLNPSILSQSEIIASDEIIAHDISSFLCLEPSDMYRIYEEQMDKQLLSIPETLIFGIASSALGISTKSVFHYMTLRLSSCIIALQPELIYGVPNKENALPPIAFRTLVSVSMIETQVQQQIATRYAAIVNLDVQAEQKLARAKAESEQAEQIQKNANKEIAGARREAEALKAKIAKLEIALRDSEAKEETLTDILVQQDSEADAEIQENPAAEPIAFPVRIAKGFKVMVYGGHTTWAGPMSQRFPDVTFRYGRNLYNYDGIKLQDLIIFQTNANSHGASIPVKNEAQKASVPILYFATAGVDTCSRQLYEILQENNALLQGEGSQ